MEKQVWTARGAVTESDKHAILSVAHINRVASRIFLTGEVYESYIGEAACALLYSINDVVVGATKGFEELGVNIEEPLFVQTRQMTVQMTRFEPRTVWHTIGTDLLKQIHLAEQERLEAEIRLDEPDFYQSFISTIKADCGEYIFPVVEKYGSLDVFYNIIYLGALLLYGKPGYMAVPVSQHFALPENVEFIKEVRYRQLNQMEQKKIEELRDKHKVVQGLTNPELNFLVSLYDQDAKK